MKIGFKEKEVKTSELKKMNFNKFLVQGWVAKKSKKTTSKGTAYYLFSIAVNTYQNNQQKTDWYMMRVYDVSIAQKINKKDLIAVKGWLKQIEVQDNKILEVVPIEIIKFNLIKQENDNDDLYDVDEFFEEVD